LACCSLVSARSFKDTCCRRMIPSMREFGQFAAQCGAFLGGSSNNDNFVLGHLACLPSRTGRYSLGCDFQPPEDFLGAYFFFRARDLFERVRDFEFEAAGRAGRELLPFSKGPNMIRMELCEAACESGSKCISKEPEK
jgi:hypothetical protein